MNQAEGTVSPAATECLVILGASNVTLSLPHLWESVHCRPTRLRQVFVAAGHGRSFGLPSTVVGRTLPSLLECGIWNRLGCSEGALSSEPARPQFVEQPSALRSDRAAAFITDIGNDLLYGAKPAVIAEWIESCVERLRRAGLPVTLTGLPMPSLRLLGRRRFQFFRRLLFPSSRLTFEDALPMAEDLNARVIEIAERFQSHLLLPQPDWYGFDPIHIRRSHRATVWRSWIEEVLSGASNSGSHSSGEQEASAEALISGSAGVSPCRPDTIAGCRPRQSRSSFARALRLWTRKPSVYWRGKRRIETTQPVLTLDNCELWLF